VTGVRKRHGAKCKGRRCSCPWQAEVYSRREQRKIRKLFSTRAAAIAWRREESVTRGAVSQERSPREPLGDPVIYFVQGEGGGPVKIGLTRTATLGSRVKALQVGYPERLRVLRTIRGGRVNERALHTRFADARLQGEWFESVPALAELCGAIPGSSSPGGTMTGTSET